MKISLFQFNPLWEEKRSNQQKIVELFKKLKVSTDVIVFPEMTLTGFTMRSKKFSETIDGETPQFYQSFAKENHLHVFAGFIENINGKYLNCLVHIDRQGNIVSKYHKVHPFSFSGENRHYEPGDSPKITQVDGVNIGMGICYDLRFPELFRYYGKKRVIAIISIANWPVQRIGHWQHLLKARAIENLCYVIGVNRVGRDKGNEYNGHSAVYGPLGEEIIEMNDKETIITIEIDKQKVVDARKKFPFLKDIRLI